MRHAGFLLVGGRSSRMGRDKALLPFRGVTLVEYVAGEVRAAAGSATLIGPAERYQHLGLPIVPDLRPDCGPLAGIWTALKVTNTESNLVVACDMPGIDRAFLEILLAEAESANCDCLMPRGPSGLPEPLCAVWRRSATPLLESALDRGIRKITDATDGLKTRFLQINSPEHFRNVNTPEEWSTQVNPDA